MRERKNDRGKNNRRANIASKDGPTARYELLQTSLEVPPKDDLLGQRDKDELHKEEQEQPGVSTLCSVGQFGRLLQWNPDFGGGIRVYRNGGGSGRRGHPEPTIRGQ